jgi:hypothetical protein
VFASRLHWRLLVATIVVLMGAALLAPFWVPAPQLVENRVLAPPPAWPKRLDDFRTFRKAADAYVADNFPSRPHLIGGLNRLRMLLGVGGSERVIVGRDGWLFFDNGSHLGAVRNDPPMRPVEIRPWLVDLAGATQAMQARGAAYLVVTPPAKEAVYPQYGPSWYRGPSPERPALSLPKLATAAGAGEVLYLYEPLVAATRRGDKTFSRHDTHWTGYGAYAGYVALIRKLQAMGVVKEPPLPLSAFTRVYGNARKSPRDLALMLGVSSFVDLDFPHFDNPQGQAKARITYLSDRRHWTGPLVIDTGETDKPVLLMARDSFSTGLVPFLLPHFSRLVLTHNQDGSWRQDLIDRFDPDIMIVEVVEAGLPVALGGAPAPTVEAVERIERVVGALQLPAPANLPRLAPPTARTRAALDDAQPAGACNLEVASLALKTGRSAVLTVGGWVSEAAPRVTSPRGLLRLRGADLDVVAPIRVDLPRSDVEAHYKLASAGKSGFTGEFVVPELPPGAYVATVYRRARGGWIACIGVQELVAP